MTAPLFTRNENNGMFDFSNVLFIPQGLSKCDLWTEFGNGAGTVCDQLRALIGHDCSPIFAKYKGIHKKATFTDTKGKKSVQVKLPLFASMYQAIIRDYKQVDKADCTWSGKDKQAVKDWYMDKNNKKKPNWELARQFALKLYMKQKGRCARTRIPIKPYLCSRQASIDRVDNSRPHTKDNCRLVVMFANAQEKGKGDGQKKMTAEAFAQYVSLP
jgi:hypothetical protein